MGWTLTDSVEEFLAAAGAALAEHPAENTVLLTVSRRMVEAGPATFGPGPARFGWWRAGDAAAVAGAFVETPPYPVRLSLMPPAAATELVAALGGAARMVGGGSAAVDTFVEAWSAATGGTATTSANQRLYRLGELTVPHAPGSVRRADGADRELLLRWFEEFMNELDGVRGDVGEAVEARLSGGAVLIWEDDGESVAVAAGSAVIAGMARIGPVYTPPDRRRRGYASAVTAAAAADAIARGAEQVLLFTDVANPTSNSIYRKLGFRPIGDDVIVKLHLP